MMALYERFADGVKVERAFTIDGSEQDARLAQLAGTDGWQRAGDDQPTPTKRPARAGKE